MARKTDPSIRTKILNDCAQAAIKLGMRDLSLASLAKKTKVSRRMLIYHFSSVERLIEDTLVQVQLLLRSHLHLALAKDKHNDTRRAILTFWESGVTPDIETTMRAYFYLIVECMDNRDKHKDFIEFSVPGWISWAKEELQGHQPQVTDTDLTLIFSVLRGLLMDYWSTQDRKRVNAALKSFLAHYQFGKAI